MFCSFGGMDYLCLFLLFWVLSSTAQNIYLAYILNKLQKANTLLSIMNGHHNGHNNKEDHKHAH